MSRSIRTVISLHHRCQYPTTTIERASHREIELIGSELENNTWKICFFEEKGEVQSNGMECSREHSRATRESFSNSSNLGTPEQLLLQ